MRNPFRQFEPAEFCADCGYQIHGHGHTRDDGERFCSECAYFQLQWDPASKRFVDEGIATLEQFANCF